MRKSIAVVLCALLLCFAFTSCRNVYIPEELLPGYGEDKVSKEEAAVIVASIVDQFDLQKIGGVGEPLLESFIEDAIEQLYADLGVKGQSVDIDFEDTSSITTAILPVINQCITEEDYGAMGISLTPVDGKGSIPLGNIIIYFYVEPTVQIVSRVLYENILPSVMKATGEYNGYSISIADFGNVTQAQLESVLTVLLEETNVSMNEDFNVTLAVDSSKLDSSLFKSAEYKYKGTINFSIDFSVVNDGSYKGGDVYIDFDKVTASTDRYLTASISGKNHRIEFDGIAADLPWIVGERENRFDITFNDPNNSVYFIPREEGTVEYDSVMVSFSMILPLTEN